MNAFVEFVRALGTSLAGKLSHLWHGLTCGCEQNHQRHRRWSGWARLIFPLLSAAALGWFLVRVIPKPIRATYPCQRAAFPIASAFVLWLVAFKGSLLALLSLRERVRRLRPYLVAACLVFASGLLAWAVNEGVKALAAAAPAWTPSDPPNSPVGTARGIFPGRVAWMRDTNATPWNGTSGHWWDDTAGINQAAVDRMMSRTLRVLSGGSSDAEAWDKIFRYHNSTHGRGNVGYQPGERIVIKINCNNTANYADADNNVDASPQSVLALVRQLVNQAGVAQTNITVYEAPNTAPSRVIPDRIFNRFHAEFPNVIGADCTGTSGRTLVQWQANAINYSVANGCGRSLPTCVVQATYVINMSLFKGHNTAGVTLTAKNHYGSINTREHTFIRASSSGMRAYSPFVDLIGHPHLGQKTILFMIDGLYGVRDVNDNVGTQYGAWNNLFGGQWSASYFISLDPVAIDSVGVDFLRSEFGASLAGGNSANCDNYLHEAASANSPPSGIFYTNQATGARQPSLGVHEHWNNATARQYSRNLGTGNGIELVAVHALAGVTVALDTPTNGAVFTSGTPVPLQATVAANFTAARRVDFYRGSSWVGASTNAPFTAIWTNTLAGLWTLTAVATDTDGLCATSAPVAITVQAATNTAPIILTQPTNQVVMAGGTARFSVEASGWPVPACQWRKDGTNLAGANAALLSLTNCTSAESGGYLAVVANSAGVVTSAVARLAVLLPPTSVSLIPTGALWRYHDRAQDLGTNWRTLAFNDSTWSNGWAELGFGDARDGRPERTLVASNGQWTTYFRCAFPNTATNGLVSLQSRLLRDDGAVVYLNGAEIFRDNLPSGTILYATPAPGACSDDGTVFYPTNVPPHLLLAGTNVVAVEVHQNALSSTDLSFNFELTAQCAGQLPQILVAPVSQSRLEGYPATFTVEAASATPLTYRWLFNDGPLAGRTNATFTLPGITTNDAGAYTVIVSNAAGAVSCGPAQLIVVTPPRLEAAFMVDGGPPCLRFTGGGLTCWVLVSSNLVDWAVLTNLPPTVGLIEVVDPAATTAPCRFYRVRIDP